MAIPAKPIRVIVPTVAGGALDNVARMVALRMSERLGQQLVVENRGGAAGVIGMDAVAKSAAGRLHGVLLRRADRAQLPRSG